MDGLQVTIVALLVVLVMLTAAQAAGYGQQGQRQLMIVSEWDGTHLTLFSPFHNAPLRKGERFTFQGGWYVKPTSILSAVKKMANGSLPSSGDDDGDDDDEGFVSQFPPNPVPVKKDPKVLRPLMGMTGTVCSVKAYGMPGVWVYKLHLSGLDADSKTLGPGYVASGVCSPATIWSWPCPKVKKEGMHSRVRLMHACRPAPNPLAREEAEALRHMGATP
jgi:hypothetical protein